MITFWRRLGEGPEEDFPDLEKYLQNPLYEASM